ncbi:hypothetical protein CRG98_047167 [Punica granatum]|uniref:Uncharacterized protein n=1 Tax=Punica granatum TaxID=22663 RepID=A0A2I0HL33_PUNGR|nr:hypothetical protein CRG98_047167 [Punica granatum]
MEGFPKDLWQPLLSGTKSPSSGPSTVEATWKRRRLWSVDFALVSQRWPTGEWLGPNDLSMSRRAAPPSGPLIWKGEIGQSAESQSKGKGKGEGNPSNEGMDGWMDACH